MKSGSCGSLLNIALFGFLWSNLTFASEEPSATCQDLGYCKTKNIRSAETFYGGPELAEDCRKCCTPDPASSTITYKTAVLEVDTHRYRDFPNVEDFLKKYQDSLFKDVLTLQYRWMSPPRLILKAGRERLTIRIDSWKTEHILEFLQEKLGMTAEK